jgi:hypothetical protein
VETLGELPEGGETDAASLMLKIQISDK